MYDLFISSSSQNNEVWAMITDTASAVNDYLLTVISAATGFDIYGNMHAVMLTPYLLLYQVQQFCSITMIQHATSSIALAMVLLSQLSKLWHLGKILQ
jgi:hypothetical protein